MFKGRRAFVTQMSLGTFLCCMAHSGFAQISEGGGVIIRVDDGVERHCISRATEDVTVNLRRILATKEKGWFTEGKEISAILSIKVNGKHGDQTSSFTLPLGFVARIESYPGGLISVPIEENIINGLTLKKSPDEYLGATIDLNLVNLDGKTALADVALAIVDVSKSLPIPSAGFTQFLSYADKYANTILDRVTARNEERDNLVKEASIRLQFSSNGQCSGEQEYTGTKAMVKAYNGSERDGIINIAQPNAYCYRVNLSPAYSIQFVARQADDKCPQAGWMDVHNPYVAFFVNAERNPSAVMLNKTSVTRTISTPTEQFLLWTPEKSDLKQAYDAMGYKAPTSGKLADKAYDFSQKKKTRTLAYFENGKESESDGLITQRVSPASAISLDLIESLTRCTANGVEKDKCVTGRR